MSAAKITVAYVLLSVAIAVFAAPGYDTLSFFVILLAGTMGCLALFCDGFPSFMWTDIDGGTHFELEGLFIDLAALGMWIGGAYLVFRATRKRWSAGLVVSTGVLWVVASAFNIVFFALRGL